MKLGLGVGLTNVYSGGGGSPALPEPDFTNAILGAFELDFSGQAGGIFAFGGLEIDNTFNKLWITTVNEDDIFEYDTTVVEDRITSAVYNNFTPLSLPAPRDLTFNPDATEVSIVNTSTDQVFVYPLTTPGTVLDGLGAPTSSYTDSTNMNAPFSVVWNNSRDRFFVITDAAVNTLISEFSAPTPGSVNGATFVTTHDFSVLGNCADFVFSASGLTMLLCELTGDNLISVPLDTPFDLGTADFGSTTVYDFSGATGDTHPDAIAMNPTQTAVYVYGSTTKKVYEILIPQDPITLNIVPMDQINPAAVFDYDARVLASYDPNVSATKVFNYINDPAYEMDFNATFPPVVLGTPGTPSADFLFDNRSTNIRQINPEPSFTNQRCITTTVNQATYVVRFTTPPTFDTEPVQTLLATQNSNPAVRGYQVYYDRVLGVLMMDFMNGNGSTVFTTANTGLTLDNDAAYILFVTFNGVGSGIGVTLRLYNQTAGTVATAVDTLMFTNTDEGTGKDSWLATDSGTSRTLTNATTNHRSGFSKVLAIAEMEAIIDQLSVRSGRVPSPVAPSAPNIIGVPTIVGTAEVGQVLTATPAPVEGSPTPVKTYQWFRAPSTPISGATSLNYTTTMDDLGFSLFLDQNAENDLGTDSVSSAPTAPVAEPASGFVPANLLYNSAKDFPISGDVPGMNFPFGLYVSQAQDFFLVTGNASQTVEFFNMPTVANPSLAVYDATKQLDVSAQTGRPEDVFMTPDGMHVMIAANDFPDDFILTYDLSVFEDPNSGIPNPAKDLLIPGGAGPVGLAYTSDGLGLAVLTSTREILFFDLTTPYDNSTAVPNVSKQLNVNFIDTQPRSLNFVDNDNKIILLGDNGNKMSLIELSVTADPSTGTYDAANDLSIGAIETSPQGMTYLEAGGRAYVIGFATDTVRVYEQ